VFDIVRTLAFTLNTVKGAVPCAFKVSLVDTNPGATIAGHVLLAVTADNFDAGNPTVTLTGSLAVKLDDSRRSVPASTSVLIADLTDSSASITSW
jgi:outer membrane receptor protein involved in Fe transport